MSERVSEHDIDQTTANIRLAGRLIDEILDDPTTLGDVPFQATVVVLPSEDPGLALRNLALAARLAATGDTVYLAGVGNVAGSGAFEGPTPHITSRWAQGGILTIRADLTATRLILDFSGGRPTSVLSIHRDVGLLVVDNSGEVVGLAVPETLASLLVQQANRGRAADIAPSVRYLSSADLPEASAALIEDLALIAA